MAPTNTTRALVGGDDAEALLSGALYTPWAVDPDEPQRLVSGALVIGEIVEDGNADLAAAAPDLARTVVEYADRIAALTSALQRTEANFISAVRGHPVRDMAETLAENARALREVEV